LYPVFLAGPAAFDWSLITLFRNGSQEVNPIEESYDSKFD